MRISDWSSDVCSSDLQRRLGASTSPTDALQFFISAPHELIDIAGNNVIAIDPHVGKMLVDRGVKLDQRRVSEGLTLASDGDQEASGRHNGTVAFLEDRKVNRRNSRLSCASRMLS